MSEVNDTTQTPEQDISTQMQNAFFGEEKIIPNPDPAANLPQNP